MPAPGFYEDEDDYEPEEEYDHDDEFERDSEISFADPGGRSALRAATADNPRNLACPSCGAPSVLTQADVECGYQCNRCADAAEGFGP
jgi:hypothetical protein